jgi:hypothetical protein
VTAFLDQLAADAAEAADVYGLASPEHDAAMDAFAEAEEEAGQQNGPECDSRGEQYRPPVQPEREAEAG